MTKPQLDSIEQEIRDRIEDAFRRGAAARTAAIVARLREVAEYRHSEEPGKRHSAAAADLIADLIEREFAPKETP